MLLLKDLLIAAGILLLAIAVSLLVWDVYFHLRERRRSLNSDSGKLTESQLKLRSSLAGKVCLFAIAAFLLAHTFAVVPAGEAAVRVSQFSGTEPQTLYPGIHFLSPFENLAVYDTRTHTLTTGSVDEDLTGAKAKHHEPLNVTAQEGLKIGLAVTVRYKLDPNRLAFIHNTLPEPVESEVVPPVVATVFRDIVPNYTIRDVFAKHREDIRQQAAGEITRKLNQDGIIVEEVMLRDIILPEDYARGLEGLIEKEQEDEGLGVQTEIERKQVQIAAYEAEQAKVRAVKQAEGGAQIRVLQAKAESDAMQYTLPLKQKQIEQTKLEAEARKEATIQNAEAEAQAKVIDGKAEQERDGLLATAEANRIRVVAAADNERLRGEALALKGNPLLINKIVAEKLSDKIQVMMVPADGKFFFASDVFKSPMQMMQQEQQTQDPPAK
ncbi:MAG TPA: SPFH domain-containing protein [Terriglobales bacterium]|nr:SPFH domain-containing protein [Terriglobales bacterium]